MKGAYYNEIDPYAAQWLRNLIAAGHIAPGDVDERDIRLVRPDDLRGYRQCHFFAGIGVWSYALRLAGWPDDREVWTGSCPCQPFSAAGKQEGTTDARHLWPEWFRLIRECHPHVVFGEQVSAAIRHGWLDLVSADLEGVDYSLGAEVMGAHSVGAPHIRQRLFFVAHADGWNTSSEGLQRRRQHGLEPQDGGVVLADTGSQGLPQRERNRRVQRQAVEAFQGQAIERGGDALGLADAERRGCEEPDVSIRPARQEQASAVERGPSYWSTADWISCADGSWRPVEPGTFPLAHGAAARVGRLRAYGNAIVAPQAAEFIRAYLDIRRAA